jgi:FkbM family methyltransferase
MIILNGIRNRLRKIRQATRLSGRVRDWPALALMSLAWHRDFSHNDPVSRLGRRLFPLLKVRTDRMNHVAVGLRSTDASHFVIFDEVVVEDVYNLDLVPFTPATILDCGGHIGLFTARAAGRFPGAKVYTFEPMPKNAEMIEGLIARNGLNVELVKAAVSDREFDTKFFERMSYGGSLSGQVEGVVDSYDVHVVDFVAFFKTLPAGPVLLKMDIEGEEENLLPKLVPLLPPKCALFFETHTADAGWSLIASALERAGFAVTLLRSREPYRDGFALRT